MTQKIENSLPGKTETAAAKSIFRALDHSLRRKIIEYLHDATETKTVTEMYEHFKIEQSVMSQHLGILRRAKLVTSTRSGKNIIYQPNYPMLSFIKVKASELHAELKAK